MKKQWTVGSNSQPKEQIPTAHAPTTATRACGVHRFPEDGRHLQLPGWLLAAPFYGGAVQGDIFAAGSSQFHELGPLQLLLRTNISAPFSEGIPMGLVQPDGFSFASAPGGADHWRVRLQLSAKKRNQDVGHRPVLLIACGEIEEGTVGRGPRNCRDGKPPSFRR